jgi:hypothetical protein
MENNGTVHGLPFHFGTPESPHFLLPKK